jgi:multidrug efflux system membrane fusion protein
VLPDEKRKRNRAGILGAVCLTIIAVAGAFYWYRAEEAGPVRGSRGGGGRAAAPVSVAVASRQDVPIYLTGIGSVQAYFTIDIRAKVDGELQEVLFTEGQHVKKGDVLAKIDPRLYQAALDQAKAKRAQDAAALVAAEKDLARARTLALKSFDTQQNVDQLQAKVDQLKASILADEALIETAQTQFDYTTIVAPSDGRIGMRLIDPGNMGPCLGFEILGNPGAQPAVGGPVHAARDLSGQGARGHEARSGRGDRLRPKQPHRARDRQTCPDRQRHRPGRRRHPPEGAVPQ